MSTAQIYDVLVVGGGPAGLTLATMLVRQLYTALIFDSGVYRNARTKHMHNVPGWDHRDPAEFRAKARADILSRYNTVKFEDTAVEKIRKLADGRFEAVDSQGRTFLGRKVALATGVRDVQPDIEGYDECWGKGIFHCLFCHGYEERGGASAGLLAQGNLSDPDKARHFLRMIHRLTNKAKIYTNGYEEISKKIKEAIKETDKISFETRPISKLSMATPGSAEVLITLADGSVLKESYMAHYPAAELNGPFVEQLGLELGTAGEIKTTPSYETSVSGVFAIGDVATPFRMVAQAIGTGSMAIGGIVSQLNDPEE